MAASKSPKKQVYAKVERLAVDPTTLYRTARLRASLTLSGAFRSPPKGLTKTSESIEAISRRKILMSLPTNAYAKEVSVACPVQLVSADEDVLVALLSIAASSARRTVLTGESPERVCLSEDKVRGKVLVINVERSELVDLLGWGRNSVSYDAVFHSLVRLAFAQVTEQPYSTEPRSTNVIGFPRVPWTEVPWNEDQADILWPPIWVPNHERKRSKEDSPINRWHQKGPVALVISSFVSEPVLYTDRRLLFGLHLLEERRGLSPTARGLYSHLVAYSWPGKEKKVAWDPILKKYYGTTPDPVLRRAAVRLLSRLPEAWDLKLSGRGQRCMISIKRPPMYSGKVKNTPKHDDLPPLNGL